MREPKLPESQREVTNESRDVTVCYVKAAVPISGWRLRLATLPLEQGRSMYLFLPCTSGSVASRLLERTPLERYSVSFRLSRAYAPSLSHAIGGLES